MPTPVGHSLAGYAFYRGIRPDDRRRNWRLLFLCLVWSNLADLDYVPGFLIGKPNVFHHQISHSLGFALVFAGLGGMLWPRREGENTFTPFVFPFFIYLSHLILDYFCADGRAPYGLQLLWPLTCDYYISPVSLFLMLDKGQTSGRFMASLFAEQNVKAMAVEIAWLGPVVLLTIVLRRKGRLSRRDATG